MPESMMARIVSTIYEPQLRKLPEYGKLLFDHLNAEYAQVLAQNISAPEREEIERISVKRAENRLGWKDIYLFEQILLRHLEVDELKRKIKTLRARFRNIAGAKDYDVYLASKPPDLETETTDAPLRQDCQFLLNEFFLRYSLMSAREHMRNNLLKIAALLAIITILVGVVVAYLNFSATSAETSGWGYGVTTLAVVMFAGIVGALVSMQQRIQAAPSEGDPIYLFSMLTHGRFGIFLSPISGAIFSVLLYLMFTGGLLSGKIFPRIITIGGAAVDLAAAVSPTPKPSPAISVSPAPTPAGSPRASVSPVATALPSLTATSTPSVTPTMTPSITTTPASSPSVVTGKPVELNLFLKETGPATGFDYALLLIWAFIAGFAERFVPDALNRLVARNEAEQAK